MLNCISKLKHRSRPKPKRGVHPWRCNNDGWLTTRTDAYYAYQSEGIAERIKKSIRKGNGPILVAC